MVVLPWPQQVHVSCAPERQTVVPGAGGAAAHLLEADDDCSPDGNIPLRIEAFLAAADDDAADQEDMLGEAAGACPLLLSQALPRTVDALRGVPVSLACALEGVLPDERAKEVPLAWPWGPTTGPHQSPGYGASLQGTTTRRNGARQRRLWAHLHLHMHAPGFDLVSGLIGRGGCHMRRIADATGAKVRVRGRGSGHLEVGGVSEAPAPLMVAVTTDFADVAGFQTAVALTLRELRATQQRFLSHCYRHGCVHAGPCYSVGATSSSAEAALADLLAWEA
mmetsp:Transcript_102060/g.263865  ORF Transcript_102060/g.263865 Transcript_102060/m.263865 type:complete len:279 (+) Transcript_102060:60-896(+)